MFTNLPSCVFTNLPSYRSDFIYTMVSSLLKPPPYPNSEAKKGFPGMSCDRSTKLSNDLAIRSLLEIQRTRNIDNESLLMLVPLPPSRSTHRWYANHHHLLLLSLAWCRPSLEARSYFHLLLGGLQGSLVVQVG